MIRYILVKAAKKDIPRLIKYKKDIIYMYSKDLAEDERNKINEYVTNSVSEMFKDYYNIVFGNISTHAISFNIYPFSLNIL